MRLACAPPAQAMGSCLQGHGASIALVARRARGAPAYAGATRGFLRPPAKSARMAPASPGHVSSSNVREVSASPSRLRDDCAVRPMRAPILVVGLICAIFVTAMMVATPSATFEARDLVDVHMHGDDGPIIITAPQAGTNPRRRLTADIPRAVRVRDVSSDVQPPGRIFRIAVTSR